MEFLTPKIIICLGGTGVPHKAQTWETLQQNQVKTLLLFSGFSRINPLTAERYGICLKRNYVSTEGVRLSTTQLAWILGDIEDCVREDHENGIIACAGLPDALVPTVVACFLLKSGRYECVEKAIAHVTYALPKLAHKIDEELIREFTGSTERSFEIKEKLI